MTTTRRVSLLVLLACVGVSHGFTKEDDICYWHHPHPSDQPHCNYVESRQRLLCFNGLQDEWRTRAERVHVLILCEWPNATFDPQEVLREFTSLRKIMIANSNLTRLSNVFPIETQFLEKVKVTGTKLRALPTDAFANLYWLKNLDLRNNAFEKIDVRVLDVPALKHVHLTGNPWRCATDTAWILDAGEGSVANKVADKDKLLCAAPYDGRPLVPVVEIIMTLQQECKRTICDCELVYVVGRAAIFAQGQMMVFNSVNCSHRGLSEMPSYLPANTTTLHLTGNKIRDLTPLATNPYYKPVRDLYVDDNLVESIVRLEGTDWLDRFRLLNLRGNRLTDLPTYALENVLHNGNAASLYLGNNSWTCDCSFTPSFQDLLIRYPNLVKDINDVRCASTSDNDNSNKQIRDLTRTEICISPDEDPWLHPLDILNIVLASLILLVIGKFLYDYWSFKKTGRLPWIVTKLP